MCSLLLFENTADSLVQKQRAFLWAGEAKCNGDQCKVAWGVCCLPKSKGGLGVLDITKRNSSLLKKFLLKFHCAPSVPWIDWLRLQYGWNENRDFGDPMSNITPIWKDMYALLVTTLFS